MLLNALVKKYNLLAETGDIPPLKYSAEKIGHVIRLSKSGEYLGHFSKKVQYEIVVGKKTRTREETPREVVPQALNRPGKQTKPNFLYDNNKYVLGLEIVDNKISTNDDLKESKKLFSILLKRYMTRQTIKT